MEGELKWGQLNSPIIVSEMLPLQPMIGGTVSFATDVSPKNDGSLKQE
jgi:hypothetical protein